MTRQTLKREAWRVRLTLAGGLRLDEPVVVAALTTLVLSLYFLALPSVDLAVSALFHSTAGFELSGNPILRGLRKSSTFALTLIVLGLLGEIVVGLRATRGHFRLYSRRALMLMIGLAMGPGLVVNGLFKSLWGRARPIQIEAFGGDADFTSVWRVSDQCGQNCSFVSGEASSAAWMVFAVILMTPPELRRWNVPPVVAYGVALSMNRLAFGGHFLSDILLSWAITAVVLTGLHRLMSTCPRAMRQARRARVGVRANAAGA